MPPQPIRHPVGNPPGTESHLDRGPVEAGLRGGADRGNDAGTALIGPSRCPHFAMTIKASHLVGGKTSGYVGQLGRRHQGWQGFRKPLPCGDV
jgi:hypothetical protein